MSELLSTTGLYVGTLLATVLTLAIFSRVWQTNGAFRLAEHLLLGLVAGYIAAVALRSVLAPGLLLPLLNDPTGEPGRWLVLLLIGLLALRFARRPGLAAIGLLPAALLAGALAALAMAGAARGTLVPQILAAGQFRYLPAPAVAANLLATVLAVLTTVSVLVYFQQRWRQPHPDDADLWSEQLLAGLGKLGYLAVMLAFGALLASTAGARLTLLIDRVQYLWRIWMGLLG